MGEAYRTRIILLYQSTVCMRGATCFLIRQDVKAKASNLTYMFYLHVFSSGKMSKRKQATLGEFGLSKKVCIVKTLNFEKKRWLYTVVAV